ncbi:IPT/TIG domain-containing protein, partial [Hymenobacter sp. AT01-02]|uniref:IPT/TIG domain-containing protein n=1 Tax=Hymenobacter sp. AT01-02 TaxID=1571877 RepID=UPI0005F0F340
MNSYTSLSKASAFALLAASLLFSSCEKEDDNVCGGMPTVSQVSAPTDRTSNLTTGKLAEWVIIQGSNFCNVQKVMFNDVEADLKDAYITSTEITLRVPRTIPKDVTNKVSVTTAAGSAETQYMVSIPALVITGMS